MGMAELDAFQHLIGVALVVGRGRGGGSEEEGGKEDGRKWREGRDKGIERSRERAQGVHSSLLRYNNVHTEVPSRAHVVFL